MNEVKEVHHYDETSKSNAWMAVLVIAIVVAAGIMIAMWQPWAAQSRTDTTIIRESAPAPASTTIINPPAVNVTPPPATEIRIENNEKASEAGSSEAGSTGGSTESATTGGR